MNPNRDTSTLPSGDVISEWVNEHMSSVFQLRATYSAHRSLDTLDESIAIARAVHETAASTAPEKVLAQVRVASLSILAELLAVRAREERNIANMEESLQCLSQAVQLLTDESEGDHIHYFDGLLMGMIGLLSIDGTMERLAEIVEIAQNLVDDRPSGKLDKALALRLLGEVCKLGLGSPKAEDYLDRAIGTQIVLLEQPELKPFLWVEALSELNLLLHEKFRISRAMEHLDSAVSATRAALDQVSSAQSGAGDNKRDLLALQVLALSLLQRYKASGEIEDLLASVDALNKAISRFSGTDRSTIGPLLVALDIIFETVYQINALYTVLIRDEMLPVVRFVNSLPEFSYSRLLCGKRLLRNPSDGHPMREPAIAWLSSMADRFEALFQQTYDIEDLETAIKLSLQALQLCEPETAGFDRCETARRHLWRLWSDHVGKIPGAEISMMAFNHGSWLPPEMVELNRPLVLEPDAFLYPGPLKESSAMGPDAMFMTTFYSRGSDMRRARPRIIALPPN